MVALVAKREFSVLFHSKAHRIAIIGLAALILLGGVAVRFLMHTDVFDDFTTPPSVTVGVEKQMSEYSSAFPATTSVEAIPHGGSEQWIKDQVAAVESGESKAADGTIFLALGGTAEAPLIFTSESAMGSSFAGVARDFTTQGIVTATVEKMLDAPLTSAQHAQLEQAFNATVVPVKAGKANSLENNPVGYLVGTCTLMLLFFAVVIGTSTISQGVVEEKSSRVVEILVSTVRPRKLLLGKILGIGAFVIVELAIWMLSALCALLISSVPIPAIQLGSLFIWAFIWVIVGFFIFATLIGGIAAMVSRQEDLGAVQTPVIFGMLIPFYLAIFLVPRQPDSIYTVVLSLIPGFSSFMMPMRQGIGGVPAWQLALALVLAVASIPVFAALAGRIYHNSILRMGKRVSFKQALGRERSE
ncbi:MAG: ABC transporter permease [Actinomycetaceae bacterium]|nr:ABC transporter permease [Arcanobacterium sp.]MDD7687409.1 ABC transporter permease [Actinomycetaceae bacterium]MDY5272883.1 ABC transporter permease [Arcanobacterium sp.]